MVGRRRGHSVGESECTGEGEIVGEHEEPGGNSEGGLTSMRECTGRGTLNDKGGQTPTDSIVITVIGSVFAVVTVGVQTWLASGRKGVTC